MTSFKGTTRNRIYTTLTDVTWTPGGKNGQAFVSSRRRITLSGAELDRLPDPHCGQTAISGDIGVPPSEQYCAKSVPPLP